MAQTRGNAANPTALSNRIRTLRHAANLTQQQAARETNVSEGSYIGWESGHHAPSPRYWPKLARTFNVPLDALFAPDGWAVLPTPWLRPETLASLSDPVAREACHRAICARMLEALEQAKPLLPVAPGRQRRTREQLLEAQAVRLAALSDRGNKRRRRELT